MKEQLYPGSPKSVPKNFTRVSLSYRLKVLVILLGVILFTVIYLAMVSASGYLVYYSITLKMGEILRITLLLKVGMILGSVMLFIFLIKFTFKRASVDNPSHIEIKRIQHPELFQFIRQLCKETGAPFPKKILITHDVNAVVFYNNTFLSLFFPTKKNLLVGLGLVNMLNLSEFKATLGHELGHFSQSSMKLGSYAYMATRIINDMVYSRDKWDETLIEWKKSESGSLAVLAVIIQAIVWILKGILIFFHLGLEKLYGPFRRQTEYHADLVGTSLAGSDAMVNALMRIEVSNQCLSFAQNHLGDASDHKIYTQNIFYHQSKALDQLKNINPGFTDFLSKSDSKKMIFSKEWDFTPSMYNFHPSDYAREWHIKKNYIKSEEDSRPAAMLFDNYRNLCEKVTRNLYKYTMDLPPGTEIQPPEKVNEFIEAELKDTYYDPKYHGVYDDRWLTLIAFENIEKLKAGSGIEKKDIQVLLDEIHGDQLKEKMKFFFQRRRDLEKVQRIISGEDRGKSFQVGFATYKSKNANKVYQKLLKQLESENKWFENYDIKVFLTYYRILEELSGSFKKEYLYRYRFHFALQKIFQTVQPLEEEIRIITAEVMDKEELTQEEHDIFVRNLNHIRQNFVIQLDAADNLRMPGLQNIKRGSPVRKFLLEERPPDRVLPYYDEDSGINVLYDQVDLVMVRLRRLYSKSLGGILVFQDSISDQYLLKRFT